jgi:site-specific DNA-methyltransferase (adenine-specific)
MKKLPLPRLDRHTELHDYLLRYCRLQPGEIWVDPERGHRIGCLDATDAAQTGRLMDGARATLAIHDPPYNLVAFEETGVADFIGACERWVVNTDAALADDSALYVWLGADQNNGFQPLPDFMLMMRNSRFRSRSFITMRNQRGYGTQRNWMAVRQELLYYVKGQPAFNVGAEYTAIPTILRGYYKNVGGVATENIERGKSENIRAGNVWVDIQQVFYRLEENVNGCYAQKPVKSIERIIRASSAENELVIDFFAHSGTTLLCAEILNRRCYTADLDPVYCEITRRRLERWRNAGKTGWQHSNPFEVEIEQDATLRELLNAVPKITDEALVSDSNSSIIIHQL